MRTLVLALSSVVIGYALGQLRGQRHEPRSSRRDRVAEARQDAGILRPSTPGALEPAAPEEEIARSLVEVVRCPEAVSGTGRICGVVLDEKRAPVAGVTITAIPQDFPDADLYRASPVVRYAARWKWETAFRRVATTGADGRYGIDGLEDGLYRLRAELRGYSFKGWRWSVYPGAVANLAASHVVELRVRIVLPDGGVAPFGLLDLTQPGLRMGSIWSPHGERCEVEPGTWTLQARHPLQESWASDRVEVEARWGEIAGPIVLRLEERPGIRGTLLLWSGDVPSAARIYLLPASAGHPPEPGAFWSADENGGRKVDLEDVASGTFGIFDLSRGVYWIAAAVPDGEIEACTRIDVGAGISEVRLRISGRPRPEPSPLEILDDISGG